MSDLWWQILVAILVLTFALPIFVEARFSFNLIQNRGVVGLFVFGIKVFYVIFSFRGKEIELKNEKETKMKKLDFQSESFAFVEEFGKQVKQKIKLKKIYAFYNLGVGDAMQTALLCGAANQLLTQIFLKVKSKKPTASLCIFDNPSFNNVEAEFVCQGQMSISLFDVVYSFVNSVILTKRRG